MYQNVSLRGERIWPLEAGRLGVEWGKLTLGPAAVGIDAQSDLSDRYPTVYRFGMLVPILGILDEIEIIGTWESDLY